MWITLEQINCLNAVQKTGSINSAAAELNKAKSAVSYSIAKLEEQLGFAVLDRSQYRMAMTIEGEAFLNKARKLLVGMESLKEDVQKISEGTETRLSLSATAIYPTDKLNKILKDVLKKFPSTEFTFHREILSGERMLREDQVDLAIYENPGKNIDVQSKKIGTTLLKLVISAKHPFLSLPKNKQTLENLATFPHIIQRSTIPEKSDASSPDDNRIRWTVSDIDSKKDMILNNFGWGRLPDHFVKKEIDKGQLTHLKSLNFDHPLEIFVSKKRSKAFGPVLKHIWDSFCEK